MAGPRLHVGMPGVRLLPPGGTARHGASCQDGGRRAAGCSSYHKTVRQRGPRHDDDDAVLDVEATLTEIRVLHAPLVREDAVLPYPAVHGDDGVLDDGAASEAQRHLARLCQRGRLVPRLVVVRPHDDGIVDRAVGRDDAVADDGLGDGAVHQHAAAVDHGVVELAALDAGRGQVLGLRVAGHHVVELEGLAGQRYLLLEERLDGADVAPVPAEGVRHDQVVLQDFWEDIRPKVGGLGEFLAEHVKEHPLLEHVDAHRRQVGGPVVRRLAVRRAVHLQALVQHRGVARRRGAVPRCVPHRLVRVPARRGLVLEFLDAAVLVHLDQRHLARRLLVHGVRAERHVRARDAVRQHQLSVVHAVEVVRLEDEDVLDCAVAPRVHRPGVLPDGIGCAAKPVGGVGRDGGCQHLDKATLAKGVAKVVCMRDVVVEQRGVVLREDVHFEDAGRDAVAQRDVDQAVAAPDLHRALGHPLGEREQPIAGAAAQHERRHGLRIHRLLLQPLLNVLRVHVRRVELPPLLAQLLHHAQLLVLLLEEALLLRRHLGLPRRTGTHTGGQPSPRLRGAAAAQPARRRHRPARRSRARYPRRR
mmetsp:Transcript_6244/g.15862  ORF Transcript_6244/g.15862 Transcript_6244/m.15862 type:complete len:587 (-) Transcript_6244:246-2006(-)